MVSEYIIQKFCTNSGLCNPKYVNHPVESQQMGWDMMFLDCVIRTASAQRQKPSVLAEPMFWCMSSNILAFDLLFKQRIQLIINDAI